MKCEIIHDLIPLYLDDCCSAESALAVEQHIKNCAECSKLVQNCKKPMPEQNIASAPKLHRIAEWKASILQSVLFALSFLAITLGVTMESRTATGDSNGAWALAVIVPAGGYLFSLVNWYFVRQYKSRKAFYVWSLVLALISSLICAVIWFVYYEMHKSFISFAEKNAAAVIIAVLSIAVGLCFSAGLSNLFARYIGKE